MSWKKWNGKKVLKEAGNAVAEGLMDGAEAIGDLSQQKVPHDEGTLSRSLRIVRDPSNPFNVYIGYGGTGFAPSPWKSSGPSSLNVTNITGLSVGMVGKKGEVINVPYAVKWHETPANFQKGRSHNYLRGPVRSKGRELTQKAIAKRMKQAL